MAHQVPKFLPTRDGRVSCEASGQSAWTMAEAKRIQGVLATLALRYRRAGNPQVHIEECVIGLDDACRAVSASIQPVGATDALEPRPSSITPE